MEITNCDIQSILERQDCIHLIGVILQEFDVDSSRDGAPYLQNFLLKTGLKDTLLIDSLLKTKKFPDDRLGEILAKHYEEMSPLLHSTYFNKKNIVQAISGVPIKPEIAPLGLQPQFNYHRYLKSMMLYFRYLLKKKDYTNAFRSIFTIV